MGGCWSSDPAVDFDGPVDFDHFHILRAIGKGAFGKVCIVKKKDTKKMYAMKYMSKVQIIKKHAVENVFREIDLLKALEHPFLVNMWYTFQDMEDIFLVLDLMLGGDLSYHLEKEGRFQVPRVRLYVAELALALDYLREKCIIHRDVKPANMLLDSAGHVHLTDFNVATVVKDHSVTSVTGTKPYMAPEILHRNGRGYSYAVDWWSLGVSAYEMLRGQRPFTVDRHMSNDDIYSQLRHTRPSASARWDTYTCDILKMLLHPDEDRRLQSVENMRRHPFFENLDWTEVESKETTPTYIPPQNRINCDPTHELEEMIVEPNPLHKKHHRLSKRHFKNEDEAVMAELERIQQRFKTYNRQQSLAQLEADALLAAEQEAKIHGASRDIGEEEESALVDGSDSTTQAKPADSLDQSEPAQTTDQSEPAQTTDQSEPAQTTDLSEPAQTTDLTKTTDRSEPAQGTDKSEPAQTTDQSEPAQTTDQSEPAQTATKSDPAQTTDLSEPAQTTDQSEPAQTTDQSEPAQTTDQQSEPAQTTDQSEPVQTADQQSEPAQTTDLTKSTDQTGPSENSHQTNKACQSRPSDEVLIGGEGSGTDDQKLLLKTESNGSIRQERSVSESETTTTDGSEKELLQ